ncbi:GtrA family protein [Naasia sp. SYSU D00948]|uniref:GtrA family protein n=1 Tax=Naasia sp. SYSU D00948 TaxID=2817379 RepID=UPI001B30B27D|nr:GtrA family protein [Naasia sp. SYSU D00948]
MLRSGGRFLIVGATSTVLELATFNLFLLVFGWDAVSAKVVSSLIALVNAYLGNREWAFRHRQGRGRMLELMLFLAVNALCTAIGAGIVAAGAVTLESFGYLSALLLNLVNIVSIGVVVLVRFALYHFVVFRAPAVTAASETVGAAAAGSRAGERSTVA